MKGGKGDYWFKLPYFSSTFVDGLNHEGLPEDFQSSLSKTKIKDQVYRIKNPEIKVQDYILVAYWDLNSKG